MSSGPLYNHVSEGGELKLAIRTGVTTGTFAVTTLVSHERDPGWIVHGQGMEPWHIEGFRHHGGVLYFYGPDLPVTPFESLLHDSAQTKPRLKAAIGVYRAIRRIVEAGVELPVLSLTALFLTDENGVFVAPPNIIARTHTHLPESSLVEYVEHHTHPDLQGEKRDAMALGVWIYRILTGSWPFPGESVGEIRDRFRSSPPRPPRALRPTLDEEITAALETLLSNPTRENAEALIKSLGSLDLVDLTLTSQETEDIRRREERRWSEGARKQKQRRYLYKNWKKLLLIGAISLVVLSVPISIVRRALEPSPLEGKSVTEVTKAFYYAMNDFDHVLMEEAVIEKAAEAKLREVTNLYVFSRMQGAMEGSSRFVDAQTWRDEGMPDLRQGHHAYGVANLRIISTKREGEQATVTVRYEKWEPAQAEEREEEEKTVPLKEAKAEASNRFENMLFFLIEERLHFVNRKEQWFIRRVETLEREPRDPMTLLKE